MAENQNRTLKDQYMLRLPDGMRERIKLAAEFNRRSMNSEIVATLENAYPNYMESDEDFSVFYAEMIRLHVNAELESDKKEAWDRLNQAVERRYPNLTVKRGFLGLPKVVDRETGKEVFSDPLAREKSDD